MSKLWVKSLWTRNFSQIDIINNVLFIEKSEEQFYVILKITYMQPDYKTFVVKNDSQTTSNTNDKLYSATLPNFILTKVIAHTYIGLLLLLLFYMYISCNIYFFFYSFLNIYNFFLRNFFLFNLKQSLKNRHNPQNSIK